MIGPFIDIKENPILVSGVGFDSRAAYNPAVIKEGDEYFMLFRGESTENDFTGRIGLARSKDGVHFTRYPEPVLVPDREFDQFGCEDPRLVKVDDTYYLTYMGNPGRYETGNICLATSRDLIHWEKYGRMFEPQKGWDHGQVKAGAVLPEKVNRRHIMYFMGEAKPWRTAIGLAYSTDLTSWYEPLDTPVLLPREGYFDSQGVEPGPPPVLTKDGIWLIYCGWSEDCVYKVGAVLFSRQDPSIILERSDEPILNALDWGKTFGGIANHAVAEGLVIDDNRWLLYYGAADRACCLAIWEGKA